MIFREFRNKLLGSKVKLSLIFNLIMLHGSDPGDVFVPSLNSEREWAKTIGFSYTAVGNAFEDFHEINLVKPVFVGNAKTWQVNVNSYAFQILTHEPLFNILTASPMNKLEKLLQTYFSKCPEINNLGIIFGSIANHTEMPTSDIDLLLFAKNEEKAKRALESKLSKLNEECLRLFGNALITKFAKSFTSKSPAWVTEAMASGIKVTFK